MLAQRKPAPRLHCSSYPIGGDTMSVTSGVVSRIEVTGYAHGAAELLGIQVRQFFFCDGALVPAHAYAFALKSTGRAAGHQLLLPAAACIPSSRLTCNDCLMPPSQQVDAAINSGNSGGPAFNDRGARLPGAWVWQFGQL